MELTLYNLKEINEWQKVVVLIIERPMVLKRPGKDKARIQSMAIS